MQYRSLPPALVVQIKRFTPAQLDGGLVQLKNHRRVHIPEQLDISQFFAAGAGEKPEPMPAQYELTAVICHDGGMVRVCDVCVCVLASASKLISLSISTLREEDTTCATCARRTRLGARGGCGSPTGS